MKKLKRLNIILGERAISFTGSKLEGEKQVITPLEFDPVKEIAYHHTSDTKTTVIHLQGLLMYEYEEEKSILQ